MFFRKKDKKIEVEDNTQEVAKSDYNVVIWEKVGNTDAFVKEFKAKRFADQEDRTIYLVNQKLNFMELLPQQEQDFVKIPLVELDIKLKKIRELLKKENLHDTAEINDKNLEYEILKLEAKKRYYTYSKDNSYIRFGKNGIKQLEFLRDGNTLFPYKRDLDTATIYVPSDTKRKKAGVSRGNKVQKYTKHQKIITGSIMLMFVMGIVLTGVNIYGAFKLYTAYDESKLADAERRSLENTNKCGDFVLTYGEKLVDITTGLEKDLNKPQTIIQGVQEK